MNRVRATAERDVRVPATVRHAVAGLLAVPALAGVVDSSWAQSVPRERVGMVVL